MQIIEFLNQNQGAALVVLTFAYVIATIIIVLYSRKSIVQSLEFEKQRNRPYVIFDLIVKDRCFYATVKNIGRQPAYDVRVTTTPDITRDVGKYERLSFIQQKIPYLPPDREIEDFIDTTPKFLKRHSETIFAVEISYRDSQGQLYKEASNASVGFFMNRMTVSTDDPLKKLESHIDRMVRILQEIQNTQRQMTWIQNRILESGILKKEIIEKNTESSKKDGQELTKNEIDYLLRIFDQEGKVFSNLLSSFTGKDTETYHEMLDKFVQIGLMRTELDYWLLTTKGYIFCEQLRQNNYPKNDKIDPSKTPD
jgi:hypothetical protein